MRATEKEKVGRQQELEEEGWVKRFTTDEPCLSEAVEQYKEIGFEVLLGTCGYFFRGLHKLYDCLYRSLQNDLHPLPRRIINTLKPWETANR